MKVLITGGAGFVGSTVASACLDNGIEPVIFDNLSVGRVEYTVGRTFYEGDIADGAVVDRIFREHPDIHAVIHCAALIVVPDSVEDPLTYYRENVSKTTDLLGHLLRNGCTRLIFSSTAALYGTEGGFVVDESSPIVPSSPYAHTKAMVEQIMRDVAAATALRALSLRYFNLVGADPRMRTGLQHRIPSHLLGRLIAWHEDGEAFAVTGTDWPTRDGSGIRDYIHIWDLALAHVAAVRRYDEVLASAPSGSLAINLGTGSGTTVRELVAAFEAVVGRTVEYTETGPRPGDVAGAYTRVDRAADLLGWKAQHSLEEGIRHSLEWTSHRDALLADAG